MRARGAGNSSKASRTAAARRVGAARAAACGRVGKNPPWVGQPRKMNRPGGGSACRVKRQGTRRGRGACAVGGQERRGARVRGKARVRGACACARWGRQAGGRRCKTTAGTGTNVQVCKAVKRAVWWGNVKPCAAKAVGQRVKAARARVKAPRAGNARGGKRARKGVRARRGR